MNTTNSAVKTVTPQPMVFTDSAAAKVYELIAEEGDFNLHLRVYIEGGGCSGFQYGFTFDETIKDGDIVIEKSLTDDDDEGGEGTSVKLLVDPMSYQYLVGAEIDYQEDIEGARFIIRNPNATTTCGCGSSFSL